jgi:antitoxin ParD1/3/4
MNKLTQPVPEDDDELFGREQSEAEIEAWIERNRDAINESLEQARREHVAGLSKPWDFEEMLAEAKREFRKRSQG